MMHALHHRRPVEQIIAELQGYLRAVEEESFLTYAMGALCALENRENPLFDHLQSPMKQILYLIDVYYSIADRQPSCDLDIKLWDKIARLLNEIELNYFVGIGFGNDGDFYRDGRDEKAAVSLMTFFHYFANARLAYDEQTLWRLAHICSTQDAALGDNLGFTTTDAIAFTHHLSSLYNGRINAAAKDAAAVHARFTAHPEEWTKLATEWLDKGLPPEQWWEQPELKSVAEFYRTNPGEYFLCETDALHCPGLSEEVNNRLIEFLRYPAEQQTGKTVYYGSERLYAGHPLIICGRKALVPYIKFAIEAFYTRLDAYLCGLEQSGVRYKQTKDKLFEQKTLDIFKRLFGTDAHYYSSYSVDGRSEQDLLIEHKGVYFVVEIKDCNLREPMRDPLKAFDRIKRDFKAAIQKGYEQCRRVEERLRSDGPVTITDGKTFRQKLYEVRTDRIKRIHSIIVTQQPYGPIQTDLSALLDNSDGGSYPWSVSIDDLEAFVLLLKKKFCKSAPGRFAEYVRLRESFHGHLICDDEHELCGYYICEPDAFRRIAHEDATVSTFSGMSDIFTAYYSTGLGFENELNADTKRATPLPRYCSHFEVTTLSYDDVR